MDHPACQLSWVCLFPITCCNLDVNFSYLCSRDWNRRDRCNFLFLLINVPSIYHTCVSIRIFFLEPKLFVSRGVPWRHSWLMTSQGDWQTAPPRLSCLPISAGESIDTPCNIGRKIGTSFSQILNIYLSQHTKQFNITWEYKNQIIHSCKNRQ